MLPSVSVRLKLTLLYGGLFLLAGAGLLAVNYALVRSQFELPFGIRVAGPGNPASRGAPRHPWAPDHAGQGR